MASAYTVSASSHCSSTALDIYAAEFAALVDQYPPRRDEAPSAWLRRLPNEAFEYFSPGLDTFGRAPQTPTEHRGRLYLIHTAIVSLWINWGLTTARERFRAQPKKSTRRAASLVTLEQYRRAGVLDTYDIEHWYYQPIEEWMVSLVCTRIRIDKVTDPSLCDRIRTQTLLKEPVATMSILRTEGALPQRSDLTLESPPSPLDENPFLALQ